ncbi:MAG: hypothetical protein H7269_01880, partial [Cellulomonas sp.]|nr:hypothetical protein [Cellulomonas sp.]
EPAQLKIRPTAAGDVLGAQRLGFYVVGRLASRLKTHVVISNVENGKGTVVAVRFPARLFELSHVPAADLSAPSVLVAPEPPVVEAVDLAVLTDGETALGLPRRRARADVEAPAIGLLSADALPADALPDDALPDDALPDAGLPDAGLPAAAGGLEVPGLEVEDAAPAEETVPERDGRMFVLAPLEQARLTPELAVRTEGWAPEVPAAASGSRLPNRANAQRKAGVDPAVAKPVTPRVAKADRGALFGGFRGRAADAPAPADRPPLDLRTIPGAHDVSEIDVAFVLPELAIDDDDDFVIPQLEPDEVPWVPEMQLAEHELVARADVPEVVPSAAAPLVTAAPVNAAPVSAAPLSAAPTVELPTVEAPVAAQPLAAPPVMSPSSFVSTLNEARAWGAEDLSASSWRPAPVAGEEPAAVVEPAPVADLPVGDRPIEPPLAPVADLPVVPDAQPSLVARTAHDAPDESTTRPVGALAGTPRPESFDQLVETSSAALESEAEPAPAAGPPARPAKRGWFSRRSTARATVAPAIVPDPAVLNLAVAELSPVAEQSPVEPFVPDIALVLVPDDADSPGVAISDVVISDVPADVSPAEPEHVASLPSRGKIGRHGRRGAPVPDFSVSAIAAPAVLPDAVQSDAVLPDAVQSDAVHPDALVPETVAPEIVVPEVVVTGAVVPEPTAPEPIVLEPQHELTTPPRAVEPLRAPTRPLRGFFGRRPAVADSHVVELEPKAVVEPEVIVVVEPEPTAVVPASDPMPSTVPWAPTSVAEIIDSALDPMPIPDAAVPELAKRASRGWWGRKSSERLKDAPWFASATELPAADSVEAVPASEPVPWISTSGEATAALAAADEPAQPLPAIVPRDDVAPAEIAAVKIETTAIETVAIETVAIEAVEIAPVSDLPAAADIVPVAVVPPTDLPSTAVLPLALPPIALPAPEVADTAKPARRGPRNWLGHKSPASPNVAGPALPTHPPTGEALRPDQSENDGRWTPSGPAPRWTPQRDMPELEAYPPSSAAPSVPSGGWAVPSWADHGSPDSAAKPEADNRGVPTPALPPVIPPTSPRGRLDDDVAAMLALRSDIQEQAFAELGQLAAYRPSVVGASNSNQLKRRVPTAVPVQAVQSDGARATTRDAAQLRSRLSSFQSGTSRGRIAAEQTVDNVPRDTDEPTDAGTVITRSRAADASGTSHQEEE